jgi:hypothetical protein
MRGQLLLVVALASSAHAGEAWVTEDTMSRNGSILTLVCVGRGPSQDLARREALETCQGTAADSLKTDINVKTMSVETDKDAAFHSEISSRTKVVGLECKVLKERAEEIQSESVDHIKCEFDLSKAKSVPIVENETVVVEKTQIGSDRQLILSTVPKCESILITGSQPRVVRCDRNPTIMFLRTEDGELIVRSPGRQPAHVMPKSGSELVQRLEVYLEQM